MIFGRFFSSGRPSKAVEMAERALRRLEESRGRLACQERSLLTLEREVVKLLGSASRLLERVKVISQTTADDIRDTQRDVDRAEKAMEALRAAHQVDAEVTIPGLLSGMEELKAQAEANIALSNHRRASLAPGNVEEM